jgi:serine/threonine protein kinase/WD40 repeat protein
MGATVISATAELARIVESATQRLQRGERIDWAQLLEEHPSIEGPLNDLVPALQLFYRSSPALGDSNTPACSAEGEPSIDEQTLDDFRLIRQIGRGGMGIVYEAEQLSLGRRVAVKILPSAAILDSKQLARFKNEARAAASLNHPNIVAIYSVGCDRGVHFHAMQLVDGVSLDRIIVELQARTNDRTSADDEPLSESSPSQTPTESDQTHSASNLSTLHTRDRAQFYRIVANLGAQAADALQHAHELGIVHRDIKPGNLLLNSSGKLWVTDFGLARMEGHDHLTMTGDVLGTFRYMSPEQARGDRVGVDHRTDLYSLGATLYELIALTPAAYGNSQSDVLRRLAADPVPLRKHDGRVPADLETILLKAIQRDANDRYASARELADDLRRFSAGQPIQARPPGFARRLASRVRRHPQASLAIGLAAILITLSTTLSAWWVDSARRESAFQRTELAHRKKLQHQAELQVHEHDYVARLQLAAFAWGQNNRGDCERLLQQLVPAPGEADLRGFEWHYLNNMCRNAPQPFASHQGDAYAAALSPDQKFLATAGHDGVRIWAWPSRASVTHLRDATEDVDGIAWSPDGARLISFSEDWHIRVYRTSDWSIETTLSVDGPLLDGRFTPDGQTMVVLEKKQSVDNVPEGRNVVLVYDTATWSPRGTLTGPRDTTYSLDLSSDGQYVAAGAIDSAFVWELSSLRLLRRLAEKPCPAVDFAQNSNRLALGLRGELRIYDVPTGNLLSSIEHPDTIRSLDFADDSRTLVAVGEQGIARIWRQLSENKWTETHQMPHAERLWSVCVDHGGVAVATGRQGSIWSWDGAASVDRRRLIAPFEFVQQWLKARASSKDPAPNFPNLVESSPEVKPQRDDTPTTSISWSADGHEVAVANILGQLTIWDRELRAPLAALATGVGHGCNVAWSPDGRWIAISGVHQLALIERHPLRQLTWIEFGDWGAPLLAFSPESDAVLAAWPARGNDPFRPMKAYSLPSLEESPSRVPVDYQIPWACSMSTGEDLGRLLAGLLGEKLSGESLAIRAIGSGKAAVSSNRRTIAKDVGVGRVQVWQESGWQSTLAVGVTRSLALSPNGRTLAIQHEDNKISVWSTFTGQQYFKLDPRLTVWSVSFSPDGTKLVAVGMGPSRRDEIAIFDAIPSVPSDRPAGEL